MKMEFILSCFLRISKREALLYPPNSSIFFFFLSLIFFDITNISPRVNYVVSVKILSGLMVRTKI